MRGTLHAMRSSDVAEYLSLLAGARTWTKPSWSRHFGATPEDVRQLTESVADLLHGQVLSRDELVSELVQDKRFKGMEEQLRSGWGGSAQASRMAGCPVLLPELVFEGDIHSPRQFSDELEWAAGSCGGSTSGHYAIPVRLRPGDP